MDILNRIKMNMAAVNRELREISKDLERVPDDDYANKRDLRQAHDKYLSQSDRLIKSYHSVSQDIDLKNREIEMRIEKMRAEIDALETFDSNMLEKDEILNYLNSQKPSGSNE